MTNDLLFAAHGVIISAGSWLLVGFIRRVDALEKQSRETKAEVRDTRYAVKRIEEHLEIAPFQYQ